MSQINIPHSDPRPYIQIRIWVPIEPQPLIPGTETKILFAALFNVTSQV